MRIAVAGIFHETNSFAPGKTELADFQGDWLAGTEELLKMYGGTGTSLGGVIDALAAEGAELTAGLYAGATPSGIVAADAAETLLEQAVASIDRTADGLILVLHGAMVSEQYDDFEGECLKRVRAAVGPKMPIAATLDLHANITETMVSLADVMVGFDTYPHVDMYDRAYEASKLLVRVIRGDARPKRAYRHTRMLVVPQAMMTDRGSMKLLMDKAFEMEQDPRILNVTVAGGFPYSDIPDAGMTFVVTSDGEQALAEQYADELRDLAVGMRERFHVHFASPKEAVAQALAEPAGQVIVAEGSDNVGGGGPGDATHVLEQLVGVTKPALIVICDREAVRHAFDVGVGGAFHCPVGGKTDRLHGEPVLIEGRVRLLSDGRYRHIGPYNTGKHMDLGLCAVVESGLLTVVLTSRREGPWDIAHVSSNGIWPGNFHMIVVKSAIAWQTAFGSFASKVIHVDSPGCCSANLRHFNYRKLRRPIYPLDETL